MNTANSAASTMCVTNITNRSIQSIVAKAEHSASHCFVSSRAQGIGACSMLETGENRASPHSDKSSNEVDTKLGTVGMSGPLVDMMEHRCAVDDRHDPANHNKLNGQIDTPTCENGRRFHSSSLFPTKLHAALLELEQKGQDHIASWAPHGRCFTIHKSQEFVDQVSSR
jgi:hypothetical protein